MKRIPIYNFKLLIVGSHEDFKLRAKNREDRDLWLECLRREVAHNPLYDLVQRRKRGVSTVERVSPKEVNFPYI